MKVLVCGGRQFDNREAVFHELHLLAEKHGHLTIIQGGAKGADLLAAKWADLCVHDLMTFKARWTNIQTPSAVIGYHADGRAYNKIAGLQRNQLMLDVGNPDLVLAFPGGAGTADMVSRAKEAGVDVYEPLGTGGTGGAGG